MKAESRRRIVTAVVSLVGMAVIILLSSTILAALWIALIWSGHFAETVLPAWLVTTARYGVWVFALMSVVTAAGFIILLYHDAVMSWAYRTVGIQKSGQTPRHPRAGG